MAWWGSWCRLVCLPEQQLSDQMSLTLRPPASPPRPHLRPHPEFLAQRWHPRPTASPLGAKHPLLHQTPLPVPDAGRPGAHLPPEPALVTLPCSHPQAAAWASPTRHRQGTLASPYLDLSLPAVVGLTRTSSSLGEPECSGSPHPGPATRPSRQPREPASASAEVQPGSQEDGTC